MWVTSSVDGTLTELGPSGATLGTFALGGFPAGIAFDGAHMWVVNVYNDTVIEL
jgi:hypothetical protein